jgi:hypothetical protein
MGLFGLNGLVKKNGHGHNHGHGASALYEERGGAGGAGAGARASCELVLVLVVVVCGLGFGVRAAGPRGGGLGGLLPHRPAPPGACLLPPCCLLLSRWLLVVMCFALADRLCSCDLRRGSCFSSLSMLLVYLHSAAATALTAGCWLLGLLGLLASSAVPYLTLARLLHNRLHVGVRMVTIPRILVRCEEELERAIFVEDQERPLPPA